MSRLLSRSSEVSEYISRSMGCFQMACMLFPRGRSVLSLRLCHGSNAALAGSGSVAFRYSPLRLDCGGLNRLTDCNSDGMMWAAVEIRGRGSERCRWWSRAARVGRAKSAKPFLRHITCYGAKMACFLSELRRPRHWKIGTLSFDASRHSVVYQSNVKHSAIALPYPAMPLLSRLRPLSSEHIASIITSCPKASFHASFSPKRPC